VSFFEIYLLYHKVDRNPEAFANLAQGRSGKRGGKKGGRKAGNFG
jgi:hypothetical protein